MTLDDPWTLLSTLQPAADGDVALVTDATDGAAILLGERAPADGDRNEVWRWRADRWELVRAGLFPRDGYHGPALAWAEPGGGVVLARIGEEQLLTTPLRDLSARSVVHVHGLAPHVAHAFAFGDPTGGAWLVAGDSSANASITWRVHGDVAVEVARGPYLVQVAFDPRARRLVGHDVHRRGYHMSEGTWHPDARLDGKLDAIVHDPRRDTLVGLAVASDARMDLVELGPDGWRPVAPATWLPTYRNQMRLAVDLRSRRLLAFGGQDFDKGGSPSAATWYGESGELRETSDPAVPPWGRYNTLLTVRSGLHSFDHSALRLHRREQAGWRQVAALPTGARIELDDRFLNVAVLDDDPLRLIMLQSEGALVEWRPGGAPVRLAPPSRARNPGPAYTQRTAIGWDPLAGRAVVGSGDCGRATHVASGGEWHKLADAPAFAPGDAAAMASTPSGLYALGKSDLRRLDRDTWIAVADGLPRAGWLALEPTRGALLAADGEAVWLSQESGWRQLVALPAPMRLGETGGHLGVDVTRDELILIHGPRLWSLRLAVLDWTGAALPTTPRKPARKPARTRTRS